MFQYFIIMKRFYQTAEIFYININSQLLIQLIWSNNKYKSQLIEKMLKKIRLKIAIIGPPQSGKTSFIRNLLCKKYEPEYQRTLSYELSIFKFTKDTQQYQIQLWQCGTEHMTYNKHIRYAFFNNSSAALLMFDLSDPKWKQKIQQWLTEAYQFNCFLIYAIGTKKDVFLQNKYNQVFGKTQQSPDQLTESLLQGKGIQTLDELQINKFFQQFQIRHYYQQATEPIHNIENDQQKLSRSSLAVGRRFDNTLIDLKGSLKESFSIYTEQMMQQSIKLEEEDSSHGRHSKSSKTQKTK